MIGRTMTKNFAITGVAGYVAPRHLRAIRDTGNNLIAAVDPNDSVGILDQFGFDVRFFTEFERFDRHLEKLRRRKEGNSVDFVSICSPNYLHDAHCRLALRVGADAICEKPLVINPWNLDLLQELEAESGKRIWTILQLRIHPALIALREKIRADRSSRQHEVTLTYITARGRWYDVSWKGSAQHSGGIATNIGIHLFDLLLWLFGPCGDSRLYLSDNRRMSGFLNLERARVSWFLSVDHADLPFQMRPGGPSSFRSITSDGEELEFTEGFTDLHTKIYQRTLAGEGFGIDDARAAIELTHQIRVSPISSPDIVAHPMLAG